MEDKYKGSASQCTELENVDHKLEAVKNAVWQDWQQASSQEESPGMEKAARKQLQGQSPEGHHFLKVNIAWTIQNVEKHVAIMIGQSSH